MKNKGTIALLVLTLLCCFMSCSKDEPTYRIPDNLRKDWNFGVGSYWIYLDEVSGRVDSCYVVAYADTIVPIAARESHMEQISMSTQCVHTDNDSEIYEDRNNLTYTTEPNLISGLRGVLVFPLDKFSESLSVDGLPFYRGSHTFNSNGVIYDNTHLYVSNSDSIYMKLGVGVVAQNRHALYGKDTLNRRYSLLRYSIQIP